VPGFGQKANAGEPFLFSKSNLACERMQMSDQAAHDGSQPFVGHAGLLSQYGVGDRVFVQITHCAAPMFSMFRHAAGVPYCLADKKQAAPGAVLFSQVVKR
jgi:hypothetical protein